MTTEQLAIVTTGAVGVLAPAVSAAFAWLREKQQAKRERVNRDLDDLGAILDELLPVRFDHTNRLTAHERRMYDEARGVHYSDGPPSLYETRRQLHAATARLVIRGGRQHALVQSLRDYLKITDEATAEMNQLREEHDVFAYSEDDLASRKGSYWSAYESFANTRTAEVGSVTK